MPEIDKPMRRAVQAVSPLAPPDFAQIYARSARRTRRRWTGWGAAGTLAATLATILTLVWLQPAPAPAFTNQVTAFVDLVYRD